MKSLRHCGLELGRDEGNGGKGEEWEKPFWLLSGVSEQLGITISPQLKLWRVSPFRLELPRKQLTFSLLIPSPFACLWHHFFCIPDFQLCTPSSGPKYSLRIVRIVVSTLWLLCLILIRHASELPDSPVARCWDSFSLLIDGWCLQTCTLVDPEGGPCIIAPDISTIEFLL